MEFNEKLAFFRKEQGMSQAELAEALDVSRQAVSRWENGLSVPSADNLIHLSRLYGISMDELVGDGPPSGPAPERPTEGPPPRTVRPWVPWALLAAAALILTLGIFIGAHFGHQEQTEVVETIPIEELERGRLDPDLIDKAPLIEDF